MNGDRNLLFGVLALQMDFITRDDLVATLHAWMLDKQRTLGEILREQGKLTPSRASLLDQLVAEHLQAHQGDAQQTLAAVPASLRLKSALRSLRESFIRGDNLKEAIARFHRQPSADSTDSSAKPAQSVDRISSVTIPRFVAPLIDAHRRGVLGLAALLRVGRSKSETKPGLSCAARASPGGRTCMARRSASARRWSR
jgi:hypothetical protein